MGIFFSHPRLTCLVLTLSALACSTARSRGDYSISNNLSATSGGVESAVGSTWITAGFGSGTTGGALRSVTLLLDNSTVGRAEVDLYSDAGLQPGSLVGTLSLSGSYTTSLSATTFTATGITLSANTNYWVVLKALTGQFDWGWTAAATGTGTGTGYQNTWGESDDAGNTWFTYDSYPTQMNVVLVSSSAVPEPSTWILWGFGVAGIALLTNKNQVHAPAVVA